MQKQLPGMTSQVYTEKVKLAQEERPVPQFGAIMGWTVTQINDTPTPVLVYTHVLLQMSNSRKSKQCRVEILPHVYTTKT